MTKVKWFFTEFGVPFDILFERIQKLKFYSNDEESVGFRVQTITKSFLLAQFIEKETLLEHVDLPNGDVFEEKRSKIIITEFKIYKDNALKLEVYDPPRSTVSFLNKLAEITGQEMTCSPIEINVYKWIENLEKSLTTKLTVTALDCNGIRLSDGVVGRFALKGQVDVRNDLIKLTANEAGTLESARCNVLWDNMPTVIDVYRTGAVKGIALGNEMVLEKLRAVTEVSWIAD